MESDDREYVYKHRVYRVTLNEAPEGELREWDDSSCECQRYHDLAKNPTVSRAEQKDCRHIREAKLYHWLNKKVSAVADGEGEENEGDEVQETLGSFVAVADG